MTDTHTIIDQLKRTLEDGFKYGASESAQYRMLKMVEELERQLNDKGHMPRPSMTPGTPQFDYYVFEKVNSQKDVDRIADRYNITEEEVLAAYARGSMNGFSI